MPMPLTTTREWSMTITAVTSRRRIMPSMNTVTMGLTPLMRAHL
jgi:hypothetical protein